MCGIAGIIDCQKQDHTVLLQDIAQKLQHRGPDDAGLVHQTASSFSFGLAARRLSIIDLTTAGHMPMSNAQESIWITYNGEIYNHQEIRQQLLQRNRVAFRSRTDTETLLHAYQELGLECFPMLEGMFAAAIVDLRQEQVVLGRDRMGIKPLYYYWDGHELAFASELKAVLLHPRVSRRINLEALEVYLTLGYVPSPYTLVEGIRKLPPGHILILKDHQLTLCPFWEPRLVVPAQDRRSDQELVAATRAAVAQAVKAQLMSDVPVGVLLSGGLDSTIVTAVARQYLQGPLHSFSVGFDTRRSEMEAFYNSDQETALAVSAQIGTRHHNIVIPDDQETIDQLDEMIAALDEPVWEPSYLSIYRMAREARQYGVKVLLTGDGADELFGGYPWHRGGLTLDRVNRLPLLRPFFKFSAWVLPPGSLKTKFEDLATKYRQDAATIYLANYGYIDYATRCQMLRVTPQEHPDAARTFMSRLLQPVEQASIMDMYSYSDLLLWIREHFNQRVDRMTMLASVEGRVPYQHNSVVDLALSIPMTRKLRPGRLKWLLGDAFADVVPSVVLKRSKRPFAAPIQAWSQGSLREALEARLYGPALERLDFLDSGKVRSFSRQFFQQFRPKEQSSRQLSAIWVLFALSTWVEHYQLTA